MLKINGIVPLNEALNPTPDVCTVWSYYNSIIIMQVIHKQTLLRTSAAKTRAHSALGLRIDNNI